MAIVPREAAVLLLLAGIGRSSEAQTWHAAVYGVAATNSEIARERQARGLGLGADVGVELGRVALDVRGLTTSLKADFSVQPDYAMNVLEGIVTYRWRAPLAFQVGIERRFLSPDFAAQEVGLLRGGLMSETRLSSLGVIRGYAAYLPLTRFSGGGDAGFGAELGLGLSVGRPGGRLAGLLEYTYQRINRSVSGDKVPIVSSVARVGVGTRF
jgi:hypothetical protein